MFFGGNDLRGKYCHDIITRLKERRLLKRIYQKELTLLPADVRDPLSKISEPEFAAARSRLEQSIFGLLEGRGVQLGAPAGGSRYYIIVHAYTIKSVRTQSKDDESTILIEERPLPMPFEQKSTLFKSIDAKLNEAFVEVYAPVGYERLAQRRTLLDSLDGPITDALVEFFRGGN